MNQNKGTLLVSVDCIKTDNLKIKTAVQSARKFADQMDLKPLALTIVSPRLFSFPFDFHDNMESEFMNSTGEVLKDLVRSSDDKVQMQTETIYQAKSSRSENIITLLNKANEKDAKAIAVFTHTKKGQSVVVPGSFISTLVSHSPIPIVVINASLEPMNKIKTILFATDFSLDSESAFQQALQAAFQIKAKLIVTHVVPTVPKETMMASSGIAGGWVNVEAYLKAEEESMAAKGNRFIEMAKEAKVEANFVLIRGTFAVAEEILETAKQQQADMIVVFEKTGPWVTLLLGSVTRQILSQAMVPVLVIPSKQKNHR